MLSVCVREINGLKHTLRINANPLYSSMFYMQWNALIYYKLDYLSFFFVTSDVAQWEMSDRVVKLRSLDFTYSQGYVVTSD